MNPIVKLDPMTTLINIGTAILTLLITVGAIQYANNADSASGSGQSSEVINKSTKDNKLESFDAQLPESIKTFIDNNKKISGVRPVNQGDLILIRHPEVNIDKGLDSGGWVECTVGYVDKEKARLYTAAHCGENGYGVYIEPNDESNTPIKIGSFVKKNDDMHRDAGYVQMDSRGMLGENILTGDHITNPSKLDRSDYLCVYSRKLEKLSCGGFANDNTTLDDNYNFYFTRENNSMPLEGDSGGPIFEYNREKKEIGNFVGTLWGRGYFDRNPIFSLSSGSNARKTGDIDPNTVLYTYGSPINQN